MHLLSKIHVAGAMYKVFCQKFQISIRTIQDFSIVIISEFVLLASRCINPYVFFSNSCFKVISSNVSVHRTGAASPWLAANMTVSVIKSYT